MGYLDLVLSSRDPLDQVVIGIGNTWYRGCASLSKLIHKRLKKVAKKKDLDYDMLENFIGRHDYRRMVQRRLKEVGGLEEFKLMNLVLSIGFDYRITPIRKALETRDDFIRYMDAFADMAKWVKNTLAKKILKLLRDTIRSRIKDAKRLDPQLEEMKRRDVYWALFERLYEITFKDSSVFYRGSHYFLLYRYTFEVALGESFDSLWSEAKREVRQKGKLEQEGHV